MNTILGNKSYVQFSRSILAMAAALVLVLFAVLSYHRIMIGMYSQPDSMVGMTHTSQAATDNCLDLCITAASVSWAQLVLAIQQAFVGILSMLATLVVAAVVISKAYSTVLRAISSSRLIRLLLYAKQRWKFKLLCLWSRLLQQGIIAPRLYA